MRYLILTLALLACLPARADDPALTALSEPGAVAIIRHALAPGTSDPSGMRLDDCATQRNLDQRGRDQSRAIGAALREAGIVFDRVLTSQWCRCRETAELMNVGPVEDFPPLNSFFEDRAARDPQTRALRRLLAGLDGTERILLVTHQVNITALTGRGVGSGELYVLGDLTADPVPVTAEFLIRP